VAQESRIGFVDCQVAPLADAHDQGTLGVRLVAGQRRAGKEKRVAETRLGTLATPPPPPHPASARSMGKISSACAICSSLASCGIPTAIPPPPTSPFQLTR